MSLSFARPRRELRRPFSSLAEMLLFGVPKIDDIASLSEVRRSIGQPLAFESLQRVLGLHGVVHA